MRSAWRPCAPPLSCCVRSSGRRSLRPTHSYMAARAGRYSVSGKTTAADARTFETNGTITLHHDASVSGMLTDGPLAGGSWDPKQLSFLLIYNAELPFLYSLRVRKPKEMPQGDERATEKQGGAGTEAQPETDRNEERQDSGPEPVRCKGSWALDGPRGLEDSYHGTLKLRLSWEAEIPPPAATPSDSSAAGKTATVAPLASLPLPGDEGNRACEVRTALSPLPLKWP